MEMAKLSMKLPQPEEQASLSMMCSITPSRTRRHFMSWPPDVQNELHARQERLGSAQMRHRFNLAGVSLKRPR